jgi:hypothetical protein
LIIDHLNYFFHKKSEKKIVKKKTWKIYKKKYMFFELNTIKFGAFEVL